LFLARDLDGRAEAPLLKKETGKNFTVFRTGYVAIDQAPQGRIEVIGFSYLAFFGAPIRMCRFEAICGRHPLK
jgi:hypothetical protein